jgi:hypothetical protein
MARTKPHKICPRCERPMTGCACAHRKASDGELVHSGCLSKYEAMLNKKRDSEQKKREE